MKRKSFLLGVAAFGLAVTSALAFKPDYRLSPGYSDASGNCQTATAICSGGANDCRVDIPEVPGTSQVLIKDFDSSCATVLKME